MTPDSSSDGTRGGEPVSVIVVSFHGATTLARCLDALTPQAVAEGVEIVVVRSQPTDHDDAGDGLSARYPGIRWIAAPPGANVARMRTAGLAVARGGILALLEDDCRPEPDWLRRVATVVDPDVGAVGGAVEPGAYRRALDWAAYFCEYGRFMAPLQSPPAQLPGTNVTYRRAALEQVGDLAWRDGFYETFIHQEIVRAGFRLEADSSMVVRHEGSWQTVPALSSRYHHGRGFAGLRVAGRAVWIRLTYAVLAFALPAVLVVRTLREIGRRRRLVREGLRAAPTIVLLSLAWSAGEFVGYLAGPGHSLERWR